MVLNTTKSLRNKRTKMVVLNDREVTFGILLLFNDEKIVNFTKNI